MKRVFLIRTVSCLIAIASLTGCSSVTFKEPFLLSEHDWLMGGGDPSRSHRSGSSVVPPYDLVWSEEVPGGLLTQPIVAVNTLFFVSTDGDLYAYNLSSGKRFGKKDIGGSIISVPQFTGTSLVVAFAKDRNHLASYSLERGKLAWMIEAAPIEASTVLNDDIVYALTLDGEFLAVNIASGELLRTQRLPDSMMASRHTRAGLTFAEGKLFYGSDGGVLGAVDAASFRMLWRIRAGSGFFASPAVQSGVLYAATREGELMAIRITDGTLLWKTDLGGFCYATPAVAEEAIYIAVADGRTLAVDRANGSILWTHQARSLNSASPVVSGNYLIVPSNDKNVYLLERKTGEEVWRYTVGGRVRVSPIPWRKYLVILSDEKRVFVLRSAADAQ